jgi:hypothetical protein
MTSAKQSQFLPLCRSGDRRSREGKLCETKPNLGWLGYLGADAMGGQSCETKPIWKGVGRGRPTHEESIMRNKAKLGSIGVSGERVVILCGATSPESGTCKTNPIPGAAAWDRAWGTTGYCAKQSQFPAGPDDPPSTLQPRPRQVNCVKRTQFARWGRAGRGLRDEGRGATGQTNPIPALMPIRRSAFPGGWADREHRDKMRHRW